MQYTQPMNTVTHLPLDDKFAIVQLPPVLNDARSADPTYIIVLDCSVGLDMYDAGNLNVHIMRLIKKTLIAKGAKLTATVVVITYGKCCRIFPTTLGDIQHVDVRCQASLKYDMADAIHELVSVMRQTKGPITLLATVNGVKQDLDLALELSNTQNVINKASALCVIRTQTSAGYVQSDPRLLATFTNLTRPSVDTKFIDLDLTYDQGNHTPATRAIIASAAGRNACEGMQTWTLYWENNPSDFDIHAHVQYPHGGSDHIWYSDRVATGGYGCLDIDDNTACNIHDPAVENIYASFPPGTVVSIKVVLFTRRDAPGVKPTTPIPFTTIFTDRGKVVSTEQHSTAKGSVDIYTHVVEESDTPDSVPARLSSQFASMAETLDQLFTTTTVNVTGVVDPITGDVSTTPIAVPLGTMLVVDDKLFAVEAKVNHVHLDSDDEKTIKPLLDLITNRVRWIRVSGTSVPKYLLTLVGRLETRYHPAPPGGMSEERKMRVSEKLRALRKPTTSIINTIRALANADLARATGTQLSSFLTGGNSVDLKYRADRCMLTRAGKIGDDTNPRNAVLKYAERRTLPAEHRVYLHQSALRGEQKTPINLPTIEQADPDACSAYSLDTQGDHDENTPQESDPDSVLFMSVGLIGLAARIKTGVYHDGPVRFTHIAPEIFSSSDAFISRVSTRRPKPTGHDWEMNAVLPTARLVGSRIFGKAAYRAIVSAMMRYGCSAAVTMPSDMERFIMGAIEFLWMKAGPLVEWERNLLRDLIETVPYLMLTRPVYVPNTHAMVGISAHWNPDSRDVVVRDDEKCDMLSAFDGAISHEIAAAITITGLTAECMRPVACPRSLVRELVRYDVWKLVRTAFKFASDTYTFNTPTHSIKTLLGINPEAVEFPPNHDVGQFHVNVGTALTRYFKMADTYRTWMSGYWNLPKVTVAQPGGTSMVLPDPAQVTLYVSEHGKCTPVPDITPQHLRYLRNLARHFGVEISDDWLLTAIVTMLALDTPQLRMPNGVPAHHALPSDGKMDASEIDAVAQRIFDQVFHAKCEEYILADVATEVKQSIADLEAIVRDNPHDEYVLDTLCDGIDIEYKAPDWMPSNPLPIDNTVLANATSVRPVQVGARMLDRAMHYIDNHGCGSTTARNLAELIYLIAARKQYRGGAIGDRKMPRTPYIRNEVVRVLESVDEDMATKFKSQVAVVPKLPKRVSNEPNRHSNNNFPSWNSWLSWCFAYGLDALDCPPDIYIGYRGKCPAEHTREQCNRCDRSDRGR